MARKAVAIRVCDRCVRQVPATDSVEMCYEGTTYKLDLCEKHASMLENDLRGWLRLGRESESQHGPGKWVPGEFTGRKKKPAEKLHIPPARTVIDLDAGEAHVDGEVRHLDEETAAPTPVPGSDVDDVDDDITFAHSAREQMTQLELSPDQVRTAVRNAWAITPSQRENVSAYLTDDLSVLVADNGTVIGLARREKVDPLPHTSEPVKKQINRKGKRGGQGRLGPRTMDDIVAAVEATPGWRVDPHRRHLAVHGPEGQRLTLPKTNGDWRGPLNALSELRRAGLDLRTSNAS